MTTLIYVGNSEGRVGRCDAKCYDAHEPDCDCICGGRNHAVGLQRALENTQEMVDPTGELRAMAATTSSSSRTCHCPLGGPTGGG